MHKYVEVGQVQYDGIVWRIFRGISAGGVGGRVGVGVDDEE